MLNDQWLVDLKHKPLEDKEVTKIVGHQELSIQERYRCVEHMKRIASVAAMN